MGQKTDKTRPPTKPPTFILIIIAAGVLLAGYYLVSEKGTQRLTPKEKAKLDMEAYQAQKKFEERLSGARFSEEEIQAANQKWKIESAREADQARKVFSAKKFEAGILEGEGPHGYRSLVDKLVLHKEPVRSSPSLEITAPPGPELDYDKELVRMVKSGVGQIYENIKVQARVFGEVSFISRDQYYSSGLPSIDLELMKNAYLEYLMYRAEGTCFVRMNEVVYDMRCPWGGGHGKLVEEPETESWIRVVDKTQKPLGWLHIHSDQVERTQ